VSPPLRPLQTEHDEARRDRLTRIDALTPWQAIEALRILAGRMPDEVDSTLRVLPRACRGCGQVVPVNGGRPL
jgi:hypothetical protein